MFEHNSNEVNTFVQIVYQLCFHCLSGALLPNSFQFIITIYTFNKQNLKSIECLIQLFEE